ncbi:UNVERIFIED_CONTAM: hypothetical protein K2H54_033516 [Gekko kuhli]
MACRGLCCCSPPGPGALNEDNARFLLLAVLIVVYMLCGAAVFSALELPRERETQLRWQARLENFSQRHNLSLAALREFLWEYEVAYVAGVRVQGVRPRWDFPGAFYFVGTVVSTIGEWSRGSRQLRAEELCLVRSSAELLPSQPFDWSDSALGCIAIGLHQICLETAGHFPAPFCAPFWGCSTPGHTAQVYK